MNDDWLRARLPVSGQDRTPYAFAPALGGGLPAQLAACYPPVGARVALGVVYGQTKSTGWLDGELHGITRAYAHARAGEDTVWTLHLDVAGEQREVALSAVSSWRRISADAAPPAAPGSVDGALAQRRDADARGTRAPLYALLRAAIMRHAADHRRDLAARPAAVVAGQREQWRESARRLDARADAYARAAEALLGDGLRRLSAGHRRRVAARWGAPVRGA